MFEKNIRNLQNYNRKHGSIARVHLNNADESHAILATIMVDSAQPIPQLNRGAVTPLSKTNKPFGLQGSPDLLQIPKEWTFVNEIPY